MNAVNDKGITEYQRIYKRAYGVELTLEEAKKQANNLVDLLWLLVSTSTKNENKYEKSKCRITKQ